MRVLLFLREHNIIGVAAFQRSVLDIAHDLNFVLLSRTVYDKPLYYRRSDSAHISRLFGRNAAVFTKEFRDLFLLWSKLKNIGNGEKFIRKAQHFRRSISYSRSKNVVGNKQSCIKQLVNEFSAVLADKIVNVSTQFIAVFRSAENLEKICSIFGNSRNIAVFANAKIFPDFNAHTRRKHSLHRIKICAESLLSEINRKSEQFV